MRIGIATGMQRELGMCIFSLGGAITYYRSFWVWQCKTCPYGHWRGTTSVNVGTENSLLMTMIDSSRCALCAR